MGGSESKPNEQQSLNLFTSDEKQNLHDLFTKITGNQNSLTDPFLQKYLPPWFEQHIKQRLFPVMCLCQSSSNDNKHLTEPKFGNFLALLLKGSYAERVWLICLMNGSRTDCAKLDDLVKTVYSIVKMYLHIIKKDTSNKTWQVHTVEEDIQTAVSFLVDLTPSETASLPDGFRQQDELEKWLSKSPLFLRIFDKVFTEVFPVIKTDLMPTSMRSLMPFVTNVDWSKTRTVLHPMSVIFINHHLPTNQQNEWRLLFSNILHGDSFSQLTRFSLGKGPSVLVVQDKDGHIFGAYVTEGWEMRPQFYGSSECFLFSLKPHYGVYTTTGYNENYMYMNQAQETMPNGMGLGGQLDYFGLWIDYTFNSGHSKAKPKCTTYGSPQLSKKPEFEVDTLEIWAVGPEKKRHDSEEDEYAKTSVLDKDLGAKAILEMAGKKQHSEGLRELTEEEPLTEEMKKKMNTIPKLF